MALFNLKFGSTNLNLGRTKSEFGSRKCFWYLISSSVIAVFLIF